MIATYPDVVFTARENRAFPGRAVRFLAGEAGIRQFLDLGTGIPTVGNTHQIAQREAPDSRVVYVDCDTVVLAHARANELSYQQLTLRSHPEIMKFSDGLDLVEPGLVQLQQRRPGLQTTRTVAG